MIEDDMSFMREIFMPDTQGNEKPRLPFNRYIVQWGYHPMSLEVMEKGDNNGALAKMRKKYGDSFMCKYKVPRPDGTIVHLSVITGMMFYSRTDAPYEVMCSADADDEGNCEPRPYQTDEDLMLLVAKLLNEGETNGLPK